MGLLYNQVAKYYQGYVSSVGQSGGIIAGLQGLWLKGSTDIAGICADYSGNVYVTDAIRHIILKITASGNITTLAGSAGVSGNNTDETVAAYGSLFNYPTGITCDKNGDLYVCDTNNHQIRKISNNKVSLVAGAATPASGTANGVGNAARFNTPYGIDIDNSGILYIADTGNHAVRKIKAGVVSTLAGWVGHSGSYPVWGDMTTAVGVSGPDARFSSPYGLTVNANGYVFVLDTDNNVIKRIDPSGRVRIFSGQPGVYGRGQGTAKLCSFQNLRYADVTRSEEIYVVDFNETGASRVMVINREGAAYPVVYWDTGDEGKYLAAVVCNPAGHIIVAESEYMVHEYSSSSSSSYVELWSSSSSSSSISSNSSSSVSSVSSSSVSSSSVSSLSSSSVSSSSVSSSSVSSNSSSSSSLQGCEPIYCASTFTTSAINGTYSWTGGYYNDKAIYNNGTYSMWYAAGIYDNWVISAVVGTAPANWLSNKVATEGCPDGTYISEVGAVEVGECSSGSSSSNSSSSVSSVSSVSSSSVSSVSSSSSSSSYVENWSTSSASSGSSSSLSSNSSSSNSSNSSSSNSSSSNSSNSSSSSSLQGCEPVYCATGFSTNNINGTYSWTGGYYNGKAVYNNGTYHLWYSSGYTKWAISTTVGAAPINWVSTKIDTNGCPDGTYDSESGAIAIGECSSSSSSSISSNSSSSNSSSSISSVSSSSISSESSESSSSVSSESSSSVSSESSSSVSSSSVSSESSSSVSSSSVSSSSVSSESSSSVSSESSSSVSSSSESSSSSYIELWSSSSSSSSISSESSSSISSESSSSNSSSSSSSLQGCESQYCASTFTTVAINGTYSWTGGSYNNKPTYNNGTYNMWYAAGVYNTWAISSAVGATPLNWVSSKTTTEGCPNGTYDTEPGTVAVGACP